MKIKRKKKNPNIVYRRGFTNPEANIQMFNHMNGTDSFGGSVGGGLAENYYDQEEIVKFKYHSRRNVDAIGYTTLSEIQDLIDGKDEYIWFADDIDDVGYNGYTLHRDDILRVYGNSEEARIANNYIRRMSR